MDPETRRWLEEIIADDAEGLLDISDPARSLSDDERAAEKFLEICRFCEQCLREPTASSHDPIEIALASNLAAFRDDPQQYRCLEGFDRFGLLKPSANRPAEPAGAPANTPPWLDDPDGLLEDDYDTETLKILDVTHVAPPKPIKQPEFVAHAVQSRDFERFEPLFQSCHAQLKAGQRVLSPFKGEPSIKEGTFFVVNGVMIYVASVAEVPRRRRHRPRARVRCILDNGKEFTPLRESLAKSLYKDGKIVSPNIDEEIARLEGPGGELYVLTSQSGDPQIQAIPNLYKIGFTDTTTEERIKNAAAEPTYLMAPVTIAARYQIPGAAAQEVEQLIHRFFSEANLSITVFDLQRKPRQATEWFSVPLAIIREAVRLLLKGEIVRYRYDRASGKIVPIGAQREG